MTKSIPETEDFLATISDSEYNRNIGTKLTASGMHVFDRISDRISDRINGIKLQVII